MRFLLLYKDLDVLYVETNNLSLFDSFTKNFTISKCVENLDEMCSVEPLSGLDNVFVESQLNRQNIPYYTDFSDLSVISEAEDGNGIESYKGIFINRNSGDFKILSGRFPDKKAMIYKHGVEGKPYIARKVLEAPMFKWIEKNAKTALDGYLMYSTAPSKWRDITMLKDYYYKAMEEMPEMFSKNRQLDVISGEEGLQEGIDIETPDYEGDGSRKREIIVSFYDKDGNLLVDDLSDTEDGRYTANVTVSSDDFGANQEIIDTINDILKSSSKEIIDNYAYVEFMYDKFNNRNVPYMIGDDKKSDTYRLTRQNLEHGVMSRRKQNLSKGFNTDTKKQIEINKIQRASSDRKYIVGEITVRGMKTVETPEGPEVDTDAILRHTGASVVEIALENPELDIVDRQVFIKIKQILNAVVEEDKELAKRVRFLIDIKDSTGLPRLEDGSLDFDEIKKSLSPSENIDASKLHEYIFNNKLDLQMPLTAFNRTEMWAYSLDGSTKPTKEGKNIWRICRAATESRKYFIEKIKYYKMEYGVELTMKDAQDLEEHYTPAQREILLCALMADSIKDKYGITLSPMDVKNLKTFFDPFEQEKILKSLDSEMIKNIITLRMQKQKNEQQ